MKPRLCLHSERKALVSVLSYFHRVWECLHLQHFHRPWEQHTGGIYPSIGLCRKQGVSAGSQRWIVFSVEHHGHLARWALAKKNQEGEFQSSHWLYRGGADFCLFRTAELLARVIALGTVGYPLEAKSCLHRKNVSPLAHHLKRISGKNCTLLVKVVFCLQLNFHHWQV